MGNRIANVILVVGYLMAFLALCLLQTDLRVARDWQELLTTFTLFVASWPAIAHAIRYILVGGR